MKLAKSRSMSLIGEIGFNAGFSSHAFLRANAGARVISFDMGWHSYCGLAKKLLDRRFPGRHTLILGDSKQTLATFGENYPHLRFDLVLIDGGMTMKLQNRTS